MEESNKSEEAEAATESGPNYESVRFWLDRTRETEKIFKKRIWNAAKKAWAEYEIGENGNDDEASEAGTGQKVKLAKLFPIYWSSIKTIVPAYWSKEPIPIAPIRYGLTDGAARTGSKLMERLGVHTLETTPFDQVMRDATLELVISDYTGTRVMLEGEKVKNQVPITPKPVEQAPGPDGQPLPMTPEQQEAAEFLMGDGQPYTGEMVGQDEGGAWYGEQEAWSNLKCYPMALSYDDWMWTPEASCKDEIDEMWFRFCYGEDEAYQMFPNIDRDDLKACMKAYARGDKKDSAKKDSSDGNQSLFLHGWEIWHKKSGNVIHLCPDYKDDFLDKKPETYGLRDFFPATCPVVGTKQRKTLFGIPTYRYVANMCEQMHEVAMRVYSLSQSIRRRMIVDKEAEGDLHTLISDADESEYIFVKGLMDIVEKGGIQNVIMTLPVGDLANSIIELSNLFEKYKQEFYEIFGVPDILRGASDPLETAKAQEIKSFAASNRFRDQMNQIAKLGRDTLEMLIDLKLGAYADNPDYIFKITGANFMEPHDKEKLGPALQLLMDDEERIVRVDFETDSTSYVNEHITQQNRNVAIKTVTEGLKALNGAPPTQMAIGFKAIQSALAGMRLGKDYMDEIDELMQQMMEQAKQPQEPPPDYQRMLIEMEGQKTQMQNMAKMRELDLKEQKQFSDDQKNRVEVALKARETDIKEFKVLIEKEREEAKTRFEQMRLAIEDVTSRFAMAMEKNRFAVEEFKVMMDVLESQKEEARLAKDAQMQIVKAASEIINKAPHVVQLEPAPPAQIELKLPEKPRGKRRMVSPIEDGMGGIKYLVEED